MIDWLNVVFPLVREYFPHRYVTIAGEGLQGCSALKRGTCIHRVIPAVTFNLGLQGFHPKDRGG